MGVGETQKNRSYLVVVKGKKKRKKKRKKKTQRTVSALPLRQELKT